MAETMTRPVNNEAHIRRLIDEWVRAIRTKDIGAVMRHYATDLVAFDVMPPQHFKGADIYRQHWQDWFDTIDGPVGFEMTELQVAAGDEVAYCHSVNRVSTHDADGKEDGTWIRATVCFRKIGGKWLVVHEHVSVPVSMESGQQ